MAQISIISSYDSGTSSSQSRSYEYKMKSIVRRKLKILTNLENPLIHNIMIFRDDLAYSESLTAYGKVECSIESSNNGIHY